ncbi:uncharacterized protein LOC116338454 [Contarinia nasturtii]|uniref:uncharacterized protein LOC116338454 n=1 Tax=Contarinia nasturtii TaxID=265458 RepID=UPI0012D42BB5|nr:uncharacterized protein LOC116338454 [Contarinia nasturtii]
MFWQLILLAFFASVRATEEEQADGNGTPYEDVCVGLIESIRFQYEFIEGTGRKDIIWIKLDSEMQENYTNKQDFAYALNEAFLRKARVRLLTKTCRTGDFGFGQFEILDIGQQK